MGYIIVIVDENLWEKDLEKIEKNEFAKIKKKILCLQSFPDLGDIKRLSNFKLADYRLRIGKYRVLFDVDVKNKKILLYRILHRKNSYRI